MRLAAVKNFDKWRVISLTPPSKSKAGGARVRAGSLCREGGIIDPFFKESLCGCEHSGRMSHV